MNKIVIVLCLFISFIEVYGQDAAIDSAKGKRDIRFEYKSLLIPTTLIGYGIVGRITPALKRFDISVRNEFREHDDQRVHLDDYTQYGPFLSVYALNAMGINGKNTFKDRTIVLATAYLLVGGSVNILKNTSKVKRPDGSDTRSFPSGHTATAFMGAEFLYQEYKDVSDWYGITGYLVAGGTGFFRMANEKHWLTDVASGAGIGILGTKIAYWAHPWMKKTIFRDNSKTNGMLIPFYNGREYGLGLSVNF